MRTTFVGTFLLMLGVVGLASRSNASTITIPPGLNPGDKYRLVFVTSTVMSYVYSDINYYNQFVNNVADSVPALAELGATWDVIGSTASIDAINNIGITNSEIYNLAGSLVAPNSSALFGSPLLSPIEYDELGRLIPTFVATGTLPDGSVVPSWALGGAIVLVGDSALTNPGVVNVVGGAVTTSGWLAHGYSGGDQLARYYAISSELTVGVSTPESATLGLTAFGAVMLLLARRRTRDCIAFPAKRLAAASR